MTTTEAKIRSAVLRLFAARGFEATGIREIAKEAGVSVASLYHYMSTKEDLLVALIRDSMERLIASGEKIVSTRDPVPFVLAALVRMHVQQHAEERVQCSVAESELRSLTGSNRTEVIDLRDRYQAIWEAVIARGVESTQFSVPDVKTTAFGILGMCTSVARWYTPGGPKTVEEIAEDYAQLALRTVCSRDIQR